MSKCPEALYGQHGEPNTAGKCPYCGEKIGPRKDYNPGHRNPHRSISREEELDLDFRRAQRDPWGEVHIPPEQDPEVDPDPDDYIYD